MREVAEPVATASPTPVPTPVPTPAEAPVPTSAEAPVPTSAEAPVPAPVPTQTPAQTPTPAASATASGLVAASEAVAGVERHLDAALDGVENRLDELAGRTSVSALKGELSQALARLGPALRQRMGAVADVVRLLEPPEHLDRYGMDPRFAGRLASVLEVLYATWWRVQARNAAAVPASGPAVIVANHAGAVPWDALVLRHALRRDHPAHRELRPLLDDREAELSVFGPLAIRAGAVRSSPDAALRILAGGDLLGVFPEGSAAARKPWRERYTVARFGRGGFAKIALRAGAPIVPCAIVGSEEAAPGISRTGWLAEQMGVPLLAQSTALRFAPAALLPLPSRWSIRFGDPIDLGGRGAEAAEDAAVVNALSERTRAAVQAMLDEDVAARSSVYL